MAMRSTFNGRTEQDFSPVENMASRVTECRDCGLTIVARWPASERRRQMIRCSVCASLMHARERAARGER